MAAGVVLHRSAAAINTVDDVIDQARSAFAAGVRQVWLAQQFDHDAISLAGLIGAAVPGLGVGTFVVPINRAIPWSSRRWHRRPRLRPTETSA